MSIFKSHYYPGSSVLCEAKSYNVKQKYEILNMQNSVPMNEIYFAVVKYVNTLHMTCVPKLPELPIKARNVIFRFDTKIKHRTCCRIRFKYILTVY